MNKKEKIVFILVALFMGWMVLTIILAGVNSHKYNDIARIYCEDNHFDDYNLFTSLFLDVKVKCSSSHEVNIKTLKSSAPSLFEED